MKKLNKHIIFKHIKDVIQNQFKFNSRNEQMMIIQTLLIDETNLILIVKIDFNKSIIFQAASLIYDSV